MNFACEIQQIVFVGCTTHNLNTGRRYNVSCCNFGVDCTYLIAHALHGLLCIVKQVPCFGNCNGIIAAQIGLNLFLLLGCFLKAVLNLGFQFVQVQNTLANQELVVDDNLGLNVLQNGVQLVVILCNVLKPNIITDGVILVQVSIFLQLCGVLVRENEVQACTVFDCAQNCVVNVTLFVKRCARKLNVTVQYGTDKRNGCTSDEITAGVKLYVENVINVCPSISVAAINHQAVTGVFNIRESLLCELFTLLTVVRIVFVKVGVQGVTQRTNGHRLQIVIIVLGKQFFIESAVTGRRNCQLIEGFEALCCCVISAVTGVTVIQRLYGILLQIQAVKPRIVLRIRKIEIGIETQMRTVILSIDIVSLVNQLLEAFLATNVLFPLQLIRHCGVHTSVCKAGELEVDVFNVKVAQFRIHCPNVLKGRQRSHYPYGDGCDGLSGLQSAKGFNVERNIRFDVLLGKCGGELSGAGQIVTVSFCHAQPRRSIVLIIGIACFSFGSKIVIRQHNVVECKAAGVLSIRFNTNAFCIACNRTGEVVRIACFGVKIRENGTVVVQCTTVIELESGKGICSLNKSSIAALICNDFQITFCQEDAIAFQILNEFLCRCNGARNLLSYVVLVVVLISVLVEKLAADNTVNGIANSLVEFQTNQLVISIVFTVDVSQQLFGRGSQLCMVK